MVSTLALLDLSEVTDQSVWETNVFQFSKLPIKCTVHCIVRVVNRSESPQS